MQPGHSTNRENFNFIGTSIEENENQRVDNQKFVPAWRQEVRDERGRRRFHGAFTGGFSAGYFNSVGSKEGWKPSEAGSREAVQKAAARKPEDFMDEEDLEDIRQSKETVAIYDVDSSSRDMQRQAIASLPNAIGSAPESLIDIFLEQPKDPIGVTILKEMGWKPGYGIGPRKPQKDPLDIYGSCDNTISYAKKKILVPPPDISLINFKPLNKSQGLNLEVDHRTAQSQATKNNFNNYLSLSQASSMHDPYDNPETNNYSSAIVDLDDDEDCIVLQRKKRRPPPPGSFVSLPVNSSVPNFPLIHKLVCHDDRPPLPSFVLAAVAYQEPWVPPLTVPSDFIPLHKFNDFIAAPSITQPQTVPSDTRGQLLGEAQVQRSIFDFLSRRDKERLSQFSTIAQTVSTKKNISVSDSALDLQLVLQHAMLDVTSAQAALRGFTPFGDTPAKQIRYRQLLQFFSKESASPPVWPEELSLDFKIQEIKDFQKAAQLFRPLSQVMASKFVSASDVTTELQPQLSPGLTMVPAKAQSTPIPIIAEPSNTPADFGMFGRLTRSVDTFTPARLLCKRFGVPEPQSGFMPENEKSTGKSRPPVNYQSTTAAAQKPTLDPSHFMSHFTNDQNEDKVAIPDSPQPSEEVTRPSTSLFLAVFGSNSDSE